jgi:hypothetical protein
MILLPVIPAQHPIEDEEPNYGCDVVSYLVLHGAEQQWQTTISVVTK